MLPVCVFETIKLFLVTEVQLRHGAETPIPRASSGNSVFFAGKKKNVENSLTGTENWKRKTNFHPNSI